VSEKTISVTMRTPGDDEDLAAGFLITLSVLLLAVAGVLARLGTDTVRELWRRSDRLERWAVEPQDGG